METDAILFVVHTAVWQRSSVQRVVGLRGFFFCIVAWLQDAAESRAWCCGLTQQQLSTTHLFVCSPLSVGWEKGKVEFGNWKKTKLMGWDKNYSLRKGREKEDGENNNIYLQGKWFTKQLLTTLWPMPSQSLRNRCHAGQRPSLCSPHMMS